MRNPIEILYNKPILNRSVNVSAEKSGEDGEIGNKVDNRPKPLHKTVSLFIQALPPKITRQELEEVYWLS